MIKNFVFLFLVLSIHNSLIFAKDEFSQESARISAELGNKIRQKIDASYEQANSFCAEKRQKLAHQQLRNNAEHFGLNRFQDRRLRPSTPMGTNPYMAWRKPVLELFVQFLRMAVENGKANSIIDDNEFSIHFKIFNVNFSRYTEAKAIVEDTLVLHAAEIELAMDKLLMSFPKMDQYPSAGEVTLMVIRFVYKNVRIGDYLMAVGTKQARTYQERARIALETLGDKVEGGTCGLLYIHSSRIVGENLAGFAKEAYENIVNGIGNASYTKEHLIGDLAQLRWFKSHAMEFMRGSPSIAEWIEKALAMAHGLELQRSQDWIDPIYQERDLADLYALSMSLPNFIKQYREHTTLRILSTKEEL